jgi:VRR-NUC domain
VNEQALSGRLSLPEHERLDGLEAIIERGVQTFVEVGEALMEIRDSRLYKQTHSSFESYLRERWKMSRPRGYQLIDAAKLSTTVDSPPENEWQARTRIGAGERVRTDGEVEVEGLQLGGSAQSTDRVSERDFEQTVTDALTLFGWRWCHFRPARTQRGWRTPLSGSPGFPDIVAVRGDRILYVELKAANGKLRDEQQAWLSNLGAAGADCHCWRPSDWPFIERLIR